MRRPPRAIILLYHNVVPDDYEVGGESPLHVRLSDFLEQIDWARKHFDPVDLDGIREATRTRRPSFAVTFDDAYEGCVSLGIPELVERGVPSALFVAPGLLSAGHPWWDRFGADLDRTLGDKSFRQRALSEGRGEEEAVTKLATESGLAPGAPGPLEAIASTEEIVRLGNEPLVSIAAHSWSHCNLAQRDDPRLGAELNDPQAWFRDHGIPAKPWLAYPYGLVSPEVIAGAKTAGYDTGVLASGGGIADIAALDPLLLPRISIPRGLSLDGFRLRMRGVLR